MERLQLTEQQQQVVNDWRAAHNASVGDPSCPNTNIVADDHCVIDNSWAIVVLGPSVQATDAAEVYVPDWDYAFALSADQLVPYTTDRIGPNGETMPIVDEQQMQALRAKANPNQAAKDERTSRRGLEHALRDGLSRLSQEEARRVRKLLQEHGVFRDKP